MSMPPVNPTDPRSNRAAIGAAAAAAVAGTLIIGPVTGVCVAGAALYATTREDEVGQIARKVRASLTFCVDANIHAILPLITHLLQAGSAACYAYDTAKQNGVFDKLMTAGKATLDKVRHLIPLHFSCCTLVTTFARIVRITTGEGAEQRVQDHGPRGPRRAGLRPRAPRHRAPRPSRHAGDIMTHVNARMRPQGKDVVGRGVTRAVTVLR
jgi:hypothetical protein